MNTLQLHPPSTLQHRSWPLTALHLVSSQLRLRLLFRLLLTSHSFNSAWLSFSLPKATHRLDITEGSVNHYLAQLSWYGVFVVGLLTSEASLMYQCHQWSTRQIPAPKPTLRILRTDRTFFWAPPAPDLNTLRTNQRDRKYILHAADASTGSQPTMNAKNDLNDFQKINGGLCTCRVKNPTKNVKNKILWPSKNSN